MSLTALLITGLVVAVGGLVFALLACRLLRGEVEASRLACRDLRLELDTTRNQLHAQKLAATLNAQLERSAGYR